MFTHNKTASIDATYRAALSEQNQNLAAERIEKQLPPLTPVQRAALYRSGISESCCRIVVFLFGEHQGARTDLISSACAVGNVSDAVIGLKKANTRKLAEIGIEVTCTKVIAKNRFNKKTQIGTWWVSIFDDDLWLQAQQEAASFIQTSANDSTFFCGTGGLSNE